MSTLAHDADFRVVVYFRKDSEGRSGYMAAYTDYPVPNADYHRGNDLSDGLYSEETLERIIADIRAVFAEHRRAQGEGGER